MKYPLDLLDHLNNILKNQNPKFKIQLTLKKMSAKTEEILESLKSLSLLEAMSTGTACVATDAGADGEVLDNGAGIVISTDNVAAQLKTIIPILVEHPSFTKDLGEKARERVLERYTITKNINSLEKVYTNLKDNHIT